MQDGHMADALDKLVISCFLNLDFSSVIYDVIAFSQYIKSLQDFIPFQELNINQTFASTLFLFLKTLEERSC